MKLGTKILAAAMGAVALSTVVGLVVQRAVIRDQGIEMTRNTMRGALIEAENVRSSISTLRTKGAFDLGELLKQQKQSKQALDESTLYSTIPVVAAWNAITELAKKENYNFRVPKHDARNSKNDPTPDEEEILRAFESGGVDEYFRVDEKANQIVYARPIKLTADCLACHGDPATSPTHDGRDAVGFRMENWKEGEVHGAFVLKADLKRVDTVVQAGMINTAKWMLPTAVLVAFAFYFLNRKMIVRPLYVAIDGLREGADQVNACADQVSSAAQQAAANSTKQADSVSQASTSLNLMQEMTQANANDAEKADALAARAQKAANRGNETVTELTNVMEAVNSSASEVCKIIRVIEDIASQTNLLALNAAVEAARAGEHGKGFAVVAEEVRALAQRSAKAAGETNALISESVDRAKKGAEVSLSVKDSLAEISGDVTQVATLLQSISGASHRQTGSVGEVHSAIKQMDATTQENAAVAEETAASAEELTAMSFSLKDQLLSDLVSVIEGDRRKERRKMYVNEGKLHDRNDQFANIQTHDISGHGLGLRTDHQVPIGDPVRLDVPSASGDQRVLSGKVVRSRPTDNGRYDLGVVLDQGVDTHEFKSKFSN